MKKYLPVLRNLCLRNMPNLVCSPPMLQQPKVAAPNRFFTSFLHQNNNFFNVIRFSSTCECLTTLETGRIRNEMGLCWKCRKNLEDNSKFFCCNCGSVLPVNISEDYFSLFGMERDFQVQPASLQQKFKLLQSLLHPDKFTLKGTTEMSISEEVSSYLNHAYFTLLKPLSRALYMLELEGVPLGEDVNADDPEFLMEIMQLNEQIAETTSTNELRTIYDKIQHEVEQLTVRISNAFHLKNVPAAKTHIISFKYYDNILEKLKEMLPPI